MKPRLNVAYMLHKAENPECNRVIVLHHGICHTREQFLPLMKQLNALRIHAAMIEQQSEHAGYFRNCLGVNQYVEGMAAAVKAILADNPALRIGSYAFHSMGALIGEEMQQRYPELARPTVLMAPIPVDGALPITLRILRRRPLSYLKAVLGLDIHSLLDTPDEVRELFFDRDTPQNLVDTTTAQLKHAPFWIYCQLVLRRLIRPRIHNDNQPKLLLYSETDEIFHPQEYQKTRERYPQLEQHRIPGGHDFFIQYAEATAKQIAEFYNRPTPQAIPGPPHFGRRPDAAKSIEGETTLEAEEQ